MPARHALRRDEPALERSLARAFRDDPMITWLVGDVPDGAREDVIVSAFMRPALQAAVRRGHTYTLDGGEFGLAGGALWAPPDHGIFDEASGAALAAALAEQAGDAAVGRLVTLAETVRALHPEGAHFYLFILGAAEQGRGVGAELLRPVLQRCDADGLPAYLESSSARNVPFYRRQGFEVVWEQAPDGGPVLRGMWREPRG